MEKVSAREKLMIEQEKGSLGDSLLYLIGGVFLFFVMFPITLYVVINGAESDTVWFGFIDTYVMMALVGFFGGLAGLYFGISGIKKYREMKKKEKEIYSSNR
jgi:hypothetical protein